MPCNPEHVFHLECLLNWANMNYTCPICRTPVITCPEEIKLYEIMQQRNLMNIHEDDLTSSIV